MAEASWYVVHTYSGYENKGFVDGLKAEFRKIVWPTQEVLAKQTAAVIAVSLVLGAIIAALDWAFRLGLTRVFQ